MSKILTTIFEYFPSLKKKKKIIRLLVSSKSWANGSFKFRAARSIPYDSTSFTPQCPQVLQFCSLI